MHPLNSRRYTELCDRMNGIFNLLQKYLEYKIADLEARPWVKENTSQQESTSQQKYYVIGRGLRLPIAIWDNLEDAKEHIVELTENNGLQLDYLSVCVGEKDVKEQLNINEVKAASISEFCDWFSRMTHLNRYDRGAK